MSNFSETISLSSGGPYDIIVDDKLAPFNLTISPINLSGFDNKVRAIEYIWGDGQTDMINFEFITTSNPYLPFPLEVGNPLNYIQEHVFYSKDLNLSIYNVKVNVYFFGTSNVSTFNVNLKLKNPDLEYTKNGYFSEFHLIKTKMFGANNTILYVFQTQNPDYILMSNVKWDSLPTAMTIAPSSLSRPYGYVLPFVNRFNSRIPVNDGINPIPYITASINIDNGGNNI